MFDNQNNGYLRGEDNPPGMQGFYPYGKWPEDSRAGQHPNTQPEAQHPTSPSQPPRTAIQANARPAGYTPAQNYRYAPYYAVVPTPPPQQAAPAQPQSTPPKSKGGRGKAGLAAAMLAAALIGGTAGGGVTTWYLTSRAPAVSGSEVSQSSAGLSQGVTAKNVMPSVVVSDGDITSVVEKAGPSVVEICLIGTTQTFFGPQQAESAGSGVILTGDGYIVTNNHVVENAQAITVRTQNGDEYEAELIGHDVKTDLAVVKIDAEGLAAVTFADSDGVNVGQMTVAIGNPLGTLGGTVTNGIVSAKDRELTIGGQTMTLMQTSAAINPGNSGGGLFDATGSLIGIVNAKSSGMDIEGLGFAIPSNLVKSVTDDLIENGYVTGRPELGIKVLQVEEDRIARYYGFSGPGIFVMETTRENGLKAGDRLIAIDGKRIESPGDVSEAVSASKAGDVMSITIERDRAEMTLDVTVSEQIPESLRGTLPVPNDL